MKIPAFIEKWRKKYTVVTCYSKYYDASDMYDALVWIEEIAGNDYFLDETHNRVNKGGYLEIKIHFRFPEDAMQFKMKWGEYTTWPRN